MRKNDTNDTAAMFQNIKSVFSNRVIQLILLAILIQLLRIFVWGVPTPNGDTPSYLDALTFLETGTAGESERYLTRILTSPLLLGFTYLFGQIFDSPLYGMLFVNIVFFILSIPVFYHLALAIFNSQTIATLASIVLITNYHFYSIGVAFFADMPGWFFMLLTSLFAVYYYKNPAHKRYFYLAIISSIIGVLFKEYGALGMLTLGMVTLLRKNTWSNRWREWLTAGSLFLLGLGLYHGIVYLNLEYSYFDWWLWNQENLGSSMYTTETLIKVLGWVFLLGWPLALLSVVQEIRTVITTGWQPYHMLLLSLVPLSISFLVWPSFLQRVAFILVPLLALLTGMYLYKLKTSSLRYCLLTGYALVFFLTPWLINVINL